MTINSDNSRKWMNDNQFRSIKKGWYFFSVDKTKCQPVSERFSSAWYTVMELIGATFNQKYFFILILN